MEPELSSSIVSRRERREAEQGGRRPRRQSEPRRQETTTGSRGRWVPRAAVLGTLAVATIAWPMTAGAEEGGEPVSPFEPEVIPGPSALDVLTAAPAASPISQTVAAAPDAALREAAAASRSADRGPLPGCDASVKPSGTNGNLSSHELCQLWQNDQSLRPDAAVSLSAMNDAFRGRFGRDMCLVSSYRTVASQAGLQSTRGGLAAPAGKSMHGWGLAIDLCSKEVGSSEVYGWITTNAATYGWENPDWAKRGGSKYEPWHWEYAKGVDEMSDVTYGRSSSTGQR